jgi:SAM-dependent methyltransferase
MLFQALEEINSRPIPFEFYTAADLWDGEHTSKRMLVYHLDKSIDVSSRNHEFIQKSVNWIISRFGLSADSHIADFGCGPGLYTTPFGERHFKVTGIDFSRRSIQYAAETADRKGLKIRYVNQNYLDFESDEKYDLVLMIMCDFCALSPEQRRRMLRKFHSLLKPGGNVLLDVYSLVAFSKIKEASTYDLTPCNGFWSPDGYYCFYNRFKYEVEKVVLDKYTIIEAERIRTVYNWLQYFSPDDVSAEISDGGFRIVDLCSDVAGKSFDPQSSEFAIVAERI